MDPLVVETLREIVKTDMRNELETMRNSDQGCSEKCKLIKTALEKEIIRHKAVVDMMRDFEWCDQCSVA